MIKFENKLEVLFSERLFHNNIYYDRYLSKDSFLVLTTRDEITIYKIIENAFDNDLKKFFDYKLEKFQVLSDFDEIRKVQTLIGGAFFVLDRYSLYYCYFNREDKYVKKEWGSGQIDLFAHNNDDCWVVVQGRDLKFNLFSEDMVTPVRENAHNSEITCVDYNFMVGVATGDENGIIKHWTGFGKNCLNEFNDFRSPIYYLKLIDEPKRLIASDNRSVYIYNLQSGIIDIEIPQLNSRINNIYHYKYRDSREGTFEFLFVTYNDGTLKVWDIINGRLEKEYDEFSYSNPAIAVTKLKFLDVAILSKDGIYLQKNYA